MYLTKWVLNNITSDCIFENSDLKNSDLKISNIINKVLESRGFKKEQEIDNFINSNPKLKDPFLLKDMEKATERIKAALDNEEKIIIYGDYDVDGITSTVVLFSYLKKQGANVDYYIPSRETDGYGLNIKSIDRLSDDCQLIITVDNGITAVDEINYANNLGIDIIVTDHHVPLEILPDAIATIDPHRKDCTSNCSELSGVGVVFKLICALEGDSQKILNDYSDVVCLGTIADVVPLVNENRTIVKAGLEKMKEAPNLGLSALLKEVAISNNDISSTSIAYKIAPRINSASRMGKTSFATQLLLCEHHIDAAQTAKQLSQINSERKSIELQMMDEINQIISENPEIIASDIIIIAKEGWNHSISGINASKLVEKYNKPCILISIDKEIANASGRSIDEFSLIDAIDFCKDCFVKYGGHFSAVGFTLKTENIELFSKKINSYAKQMLSQHVTKSFNIDCEITLDDISIKNIKDLKLLEPFGSGNEPPLIMIKDLKIKSIISLSNGKYTKIVATDKNNFKIDFLTFKIAYQDFLYQIGEVVDIVVTLDLSTYNNKTSPFIVLKDIRPAGFEQDLYFQNVLEYNNYKNNKNKNLNIKLIKDNLPTRNEVGTVYKYLKNIQNFTYTNPHDLTEYLFIKLLKYNLNYIKLRLSLDILQEMQIVSLDSKVKILNPDQKADIKSTATYKTLA